MVLKVLLIDSCAASTRLIENSFNSIPQLELLPTDQSVKSIEQTVSHIIDSSAKVILLALDGADQKAIQVVQAVMRRKPKPIVLLSAEGTDQQNTTIFNCLHAGAVDVVRIPQNMTAHSEAQFQQKLARTIQVMSQACLVTRRHAEDKKPSPCDGHHRNKIVVIGASTGGPSVLYKILSQLQSPFEGSILITQHITVGFAQGMADWLSTTGHRVTLVKAKTRLEENQIYLSPADKDLKVVDDFSCDIEAGDPLRSPSIDRLFDSAAKVFGKRATGILLTGMGRDGSQGLKAISENQGITIAQTEETCVVNGMPEAARQIGAVIWNKSPNEIAEFLCDHCKACG